MYPFLLLINRCNLFQGPSDAQFFWGEAAVPDGYASVADMQEATVSQEQQPSQSDWWGSAEAAQVFFCFILFKTGSCNCSSALHSLLGRCFLQPKESAAQC